MARSCLAIILAAGEGTRMRSTTPKILHEIAGLPMVGHVLNAIDSREQDRTAVVVGTSAERVAKAVTEIRPGVEVFVQKERLGTAHAVLAAREALLDPTDDVIVLFGDVPLILPQTLSGMRQMLADGADVVVLGFHTDDPTGYGRMLEENGELVAIREHKDATEEERAVDFCNSGIMGFRGAHMLKILDAISNDNAQNEYYLTDVVSVARAMGKKVLAAAVPEEETLGVNNRVQLAEAETLWQNRKRRELMLAGVSMQAPETVQLAHDTKIGSDTILEPNIVFGPGVTIADNAQIRAFSHLEGATVGENVVVGPYARLRPGTELQAGSKVGNFCEIKNATVEPGAKVNHLTYIGDARVGANANIGAGTITCNYDGMNKHHTDIGAGVFVGSNSSLVAPVSLGDGSYIGSGSVITKPVEPNALAIGRGKQVNFEGRAEILRARIAAEKERRKKS